jgi:PAS domain S-box-containing protein
VREAASPQDLRLLADEWSPAFDAVEDLVCLLAIDGTIVRCNRRMTAFLELEPDQAIGRKCYELMHGARMFFPDCPFAEMRETGARETLELPLGDRWYQVTADPVLEDGILIGAVHILRDVTDFRRAVDNTAERERRLQILNDLAVDLAARPQHADLSRFLAGRLLAMTEGVAVAFSEYDAEHSVLETRAIELRPGVVQKVSAPLVRRLERTRSPVSPEVLAEMLSTRVGMRRTLTEASFGDIPPSVDRTVRSLLGVDRFLGIGFVVEGSLFGTAVIALQSGAPDPPSELIEAFRHLAAVSLRQEKQVRAAEAELRRASAYHRSLLEAALDPLVTIGPDGLITDVNEATVRATGRVRDELLGTDFADYFTEPGRARASYERVFREGSVRDYPLRMMHADGSITEVEYNASTYRDADGSVAGVFAAARDVTELKRAEAEIRELNRDLERRVRARTAELATANRDLQEFVYSVAHDLRTPLRAVDGFSLAVLEEHGGTIGEDGRSDLRRVRAAAQTMGELIDALLSLTRVSHREVRIELVDLSEIAQRVLEDLQSAEPERRVEVDVAAGLSADTDAALAEVVLQNLLGNAWKFTATQSMAHIEVGAGPAGDAPWFFIRDDGVGFDPAYVDKLFVPFQRLHVADGFPGTGIGLATVARVLERLGGSWRAEGEDGKGATFYFSFGDGEDEAADPRD